MRGKEGCGHRVVVEMRGAIGAAKCAATSPKRREMMVGRAGWILKSVILVFSIFVLLR